MNVTLVPLVALVPATDPTVTEVGVTEAAATGREKVRVTSLSVATDDEPLVGETWLTTRGVGVVPFPSPGSQPGSVGLQTGLSLPPQAAKNPARAARVHIFGA